MARTFLFHVLISLFTTVFFCCCAEEPFPSVPSTPPKEAQSELRLSDQQLLEKLKKYIPYDAKGPNFAGRIYIGGKDQSINQSTWIYVKTALDEYKKTKPKMIILELDTPGGEVFAAQKISDALKEMDTLHNIPVVALINNWAISAGAMLAYSCRFIVIVRDAAMGAAEPVYIGTEGQMVSASEKVSSALRADFSNHASYFDRNAILAEAMVDKDVIVVLRDGKIVKLDDETQIRKTDPNPDEVISAKGKLLTLNANQMMRFGVADIKLESVRVEPITPVELEKGVWPGKKMSLFHTLFFDQIPDVMVATYQMDWKTAFVAFLSHPVAQSILFLALMLGIYLEVNSPGLGLPALVSLTSLALIILSSFALEAASMLELIMVLAGMALLALEVFVFPGFGFPGILGLLLIFGGIFALMLPDIRSIDYRFDEHTWNAAGEEFLNRLAWLCGTFVLGLILIAALGRYVMPKFSLFKKFVSEGGEDTSSGYVSGLTSKELPPIGAQGSVFATLRPAGKMMYAGEVYDAVSDGRYIEQGTAVRVIEISGGRLVVAPLVEEV